MIGFALSLLLASADLGAAAQLPPDPDAPTVGASLDKSEAHVGDRLTLTISAVAKTGVAIRMPGKIDLGKLEVLDRDDGDKLGRDLGDGRRSYRFVLGVAAYEVGALEVPSIELSYNNARGEIRTEKTAPIDLEIKALVQEAETQAEPQSIRPPRSALVEDRRVMRAIRYGAIAVAALLIAMVVVRLRRRFRRSAVVMTETLAPSRPADEVAMERLTELRNAGNFGAEGYRLFYFAVAEVIRTYLGARYRFDSLELTTTELLAELTTRAPKLAAADGAVSRFLSDSDFVKFAKAGSNDAAALKILDAAQSIVLSTSEALESAAKSPGEDAKVSHG